VGKIYNDEWMMDRGFLDVKTAQDLLNGIGKRRLVILGKEQKISEALELMNKYNIETIPVLQDREPVGVITQNGLFRKMIENVSLQEATVREVMEAPLKVIDAVTPIDKLGAMFNKDNAAVLVKEEATGEYHILTQYDLLSKMM